MGLFDLFSDGKEHERAYGKGVEDSQKEGFVEKAAHGIGDVSDILGKGSTEHQSYEAGYHSGKKSKRRRTSSPGYARSYSESPREILTKLGWTLVILAAIVGLVYLARPTSRGRGYYIGASRRINANQLNLRSGPGTDYRIIRTFTRGEVVLEFGQEEKRDGRVWIQVSTTDGLTEGWMVRKYLSP